MQVDDGWRSLKHPNGDILMAKAPATKKNAAAKKTPTKKVAVKKAATKKSLV